MIFVTGGAGFIGSNFVLEWLKSNDESVVNFDKLTYAGNLENLKSLGDDPRHIFVQGDICDQDQVQALFLQYRPRAILHFAAESHVDRSIDGPADFIETNVVGTLVLLEAARQYVEESGKKNFRFHHISTDEVYGDLEGDTDLFTEETSYAPSSPYSASKASSDHLVRAWGRTYGLPCVITNCSNNYGPYHFPEKLIPHMILNALSGKALPVYGDGKQTRCFSYIDDCLSCLIPMLDQKNLNKEIINIGPDEEFVTINKIAEICSNITGINLSPIYKKDRPKEVKHATCSADKARDLLKYQTKVSLQDGIKKTFDYIKKRGTRPFDYNINIEINNELTPSTWKNKEI